MKHIGVIEGESVTRIVWNEHCNQIAVGCSDAVIRMYYDPKLSTKGALLCAGKAPRIKDKYDYTPARPIYTPHAILKDDSQKSHKRKRESDRKDPVKSKLPDPPSQGPNSRLHAGSSMTQHLLRGIIKDTMRHEDPREAILRHAKDAEANPIFTSAYAATQPKTIFHVEEEEGDDDDDK